MTQHHDPVHPEPGDLEPVPTLTADDERAVHDLLAGLGPVAMPDHVAARIAATLAAEPPVLATSSPAPVPAAMAAPAATVTALDSRRRRWGSTRLLAAAASVVLVAGGVVVTVKAMGSGSADGGSAAELSAGDAALPRRALVTTSGVAYTKAALPDQVRRLIVDKAGATNAGAQAVTRDAADLVRTDDRLASCLAALEEGSDEVLTPVAVDAGSYESAAAVVVVLPALDPARLDVFVVAPACSIADAKMITYVSIARP